MRDIELKGKYIPTGHVRTSGFCSSRWYWEVLKTDDEGITVKLFDAAYAEPERMSYRKIDELIICYGLWDKVGMADFVRADDPALQWIKYAHSYPEEAGRRIYKLQRELERERERNNGSKLK